MSQVFNEEEIEAKAREYEEALRAEMGLESETASHFARPPERPFTRDQRDSTTILFGGLSVAHEQLVTEAMRGMGYLVRPLPTPDNDSLRLGKELGNRGQCNPSYYTVGNLVKYLKELREQGEEDIEDRYVFITAGGCGPCRFGMYEAEFRKALREAGFNEFRVLLFDQRAGFNQSAEDEAIQLNGRFAISMLRGMLIGDLVNDLGYQVRPYEKDPGETDRVIEKSKIILGDALRENRSVWKALRRVKKLFGEIAVDYTQAKPKVKITGEFWAQTTEGDGNYHMFRWLESEGAEVVVEPIGTWIEYLIFMSTQDAEERMRLDKSKKSLVRKIKALKVVYRLWYDFYRWALGFKTEPLPSQKKLAEYAKAYYNTHLRGGEGHLEISKNIMAAKDGHANMVISLKPFGCMPSTMSDGVQSLVVANYKDAIYLPVETSGDGEVSVKSRVQMKLYEAKLKARQELADTLKAKGATLEQVREYVAKHPKYAKAMQRLPRHGPITTAGRFVSTVAGRA